MKKILLALLLPFLGVANLSAQDTRMLLTQHEGYWLTYSERIEQLYQGVYVAQETYYSNDGYTSILLNENGDYNWVETYQVNTAKWRLVSDSELQVYDPDTGVELTYTIAELTESRLVLSQHLVADDLEQYKITTYCRSDCRLSEDEVEQLNGQGAFEIDGFTDYKNRGTSVAASPNIYTSINSHIKELRVVEPSANSAAIAQKALIYWFVNSALNRSHYVAFDRPYYFHNALLSPNLSGVKTFSISTSESSRKKVLQCKLDKAGLITAIVEDGEELKLSYKNGLPVKLEDSYNIYYKENTITIESEGHIVEHFGLDDDLKVILQRSCLDGFTGEDVKTVYFDSHTGTLYHWEKPIGTGGNGDKYVYSVSNNGEIPFTVTLESEYTTYNVERPNDTLIEITEYECEYYGRGSLEEGMELAYRSACKVHLNSKGNPVKVEDYDEDEQLENTYTFSYAYY